MQARLLEGKTALITGAAAGIGSATAELFASQGAHVWALDINEEGAGAVAAAIRSGGGSARSLKLDVRKPEDFRRAVDDALAAYSKVDILINNAGIYPRRTFLDMTGEEWDEMQEVNLKGVFHGMKAVAPAMVAQRSGKIVNISSVTFFKGLENLSHYVASKGGVIGLTRVVARELGSHNVHVNCITPGAIEVEMEKKVATLEQMAAIMEQQSLKRRLQPLEVARVCLFLSCELSDAMTGQIVNVDGGLVMH